MSVTMGPLKKATVKLRHKFALVLDLQLVFRSSKAIIMAFKATPYRTELFV